MTGNTRIGKEIAGFRIESILGRGGMSVVYIAEQIRLGRQVALKLLAAELGWDEQFRERFVRESNVAAAIDHPNIIPIYDAGESDGVLYIAMRLIRGPDLKDILKRDQRLSVGHTLFLIEQVSSALDAAHAHGLVHRDVKPANILVEEGSDRVYLTDFGIAKQTIARGLTSTGHFLGTVDYAAPEQIEGRAVDARTDVYALGCVLFECLTGSPPYAQGSEHAVLQAHLVEPPPSITRARPELPQSFDRVISTAMAKDSADRFSSCGELADAVRRAASGTTSRSTTDFDRPRAAAETLLSAPRQLSEAGAPITATEPGAAESSAREPAIDERSPQALDTRRWPRRRLLVSAGAGLFLLAGGAAAAIALLTGGSSHSSSPPGSTKPMSMSTAAAMSTNSSTMSMQQTTPTGTPAQRLNALINHPGWRCQTNPLDAPSAAAASADCSTQVPQYLQVSFFPTKRALYSAYNRLRALDGPAPNTGACSAEAWGGENQWFHAAQVPGGRDFCYLDIAKKRSNLIWTSDTNSMILFVARLNALTHPDLFYWWARLRHDLV
jgi:serine/threonine-protein kinase